MEDKWETAQNLWRSGDEPYPNKVAAGKHYRVEQTNIGQAAKVTFQILQFPP